MYIADRQFPLFPNRPMHRDPLPHLSALELVKRTGSQVSVMTQRTVASILFLVVALALSPSASAKAETVKLTVSGAELAKPVELTDPEAIAADVFAGNFAEWNRQRVESPDARLPRYMIELHLRPPRTTASRIMYVVTFVWDAENEEGLVYLPGPGERSYNLNISTIDRAGRDGKWHYADPRWSRAITEALDSFDRRVSRR